VDVFPGIEKWELAKWKNKEVSGEAVSVEKSRL